MSAPQFTPGPWHLAADGQMVFGPDNLVIGETIHGLGRTIQEVAANAHLIAAAPELCERTARRLDQMERFLSKLSPADRLGGYGVLLSAWIDEDRALLVKARGEQVPA